MSDNIVLLERMRINVADPIDVEQQITARDIHALHAAVRDLEADWRTGIKSKTALEADIGSLMGDHFRLAALIRTILLARKPSDVAS